MFMWCFCLCDGSQKENRVLALFLSFVHFRVYLDMICSVFVCLALRVFSSPSVAV